MSDCANVVRGGRFAVSLPASLCALILFGGADLRIANAQGTPAPRAQAAASTAQQSNIAAKRYYIEFRARSALSYGHSFVIYGRLGTQGRVAASQVVGLHPATESSVPWMIGHFVPVPAETGASDGDTEDQYVIARFRVVLNEAEYAKVSNYLKERRKNSPVWHAAVYNCNAFVGDIARFMGLEVPQAIWAMPKDYIDGIRDANINRRDFANMTGTPVKVASAEQLRAEALRATAQRERRKTAPAKPAVATR